MQSKKIVIVGSANIDITVYVDQLPKPGETLTAVSSSIGSGGKGANQAVAAALLGGNVSLIARIGTDSYGDTLIKSLTAAGVDTKFVKRDVKLPTGVAQITVSADGENTIVVAQGSNQNLTTADVLAAEDLIASADTLVCSLEIPMKTLEAAIMLAHRFDVRSILNPAPAQILSPQLLKQIAILVPNEHEVGLLLANIAKDPASSSMRLIKEGADTVIVTLGSAGAQAYSQDGVQLQIPAVPVEKVVDTTGAGDCYIGALAVALTEGQLLQFAMEFAASAAAFCVTKPGAQSSMPKRSEI